MRNTEIKDEKISWNKIPPLGRAEFSGLVVSRWSWFCLWQDDTEVRVYEDENTGENEMIVEISTGPKGS